MVTLLSSPIFTVVSEVELALSSSFIVLQLFIASTSAAASSVDVSASVSAAVFVMLSETEELSFDAALLPPPLLPDAHPAINRDAASIIAAVFLRFFFLMSSPCVVFHVTSIYYK